MFPPSTSRWRVIVWGCRDRDALPPRRAGLSTCALGTLCSGKIPIIHQVGVGVQSVTLSPLQRPSSRSPDPEQWESPAGHEGLKQSQVQCQRWPPGMDLVCLVLGSWFHPWPPYSEASASDHKLSVFEQMDPWLHPAPSNMVPPCSKLIYSGTVQGQRHRHG